MLELHKMADAFVKASPKLVKDALAAKNKENSANSTAIEIKMSLDS